MAEQLTLNQWVGGSTPPGCTITSPQLHDLDLRAYCLEPEQFAFALLMATRLFRISPLIIGVKSVIAIMKSEREYLL